MQVEQEGDEEDMYNFLYLSFNHYVMLNERQKALDVATRMTTLPSSTADLSWYVGEDLFTKFGDPELALVHVEQGLRKAETDAELGSRFNATVHLKSLERAIRSSLATEIEDPYRHLYRL